jgi:putative Mn2+ efflux pump MntP
MSHRLTSTHQMIWLPCLLLGILLMIVGATEGVPYTSIHVRGESVQIAIGVVGLVLAAIGVYVGFEIGKKKK